MIFLFLFHSSHLNGQFCPSVIFSYRLAILAASLPVLLPRFFSAVLVHLSHLDRPPSASLHRPLPARLSHHLSISPRAAPRSPRPPHLPRTSPRSAPTSWPGPRAPAPPRSHRALGRTMCVGMVAAANWEAVAEHGAEPHELESCSGGA